MADTVKTYIEKVLELRETSEVEAWSEQELKEIAREIGLSEEELAAIDKRINDSAERALGFMKHELWGEAVDAWQDALSFAPSRTRYQLKLAECLIRRSRGDDRQHAKGLLDGVLSKEPSNSQAFGLMKQLKSNNALVATGSTGPQKSKTPFLLTGLVAGTGLLVVLIAGLAAGMLFVSGDDERGTVIEPTVIDGNTPKVSTTHNDSGFPIEIKTPNGIKVKVHESVYDVYDDSSFYKMKALVTNATSKEIETMKAHFTYVLENGDEVKDDTEILGTHESPMRPKDVHPMSELHKVETSRLKRVVMRVSHGPATAAGTYAESDAMETKYAKGVDGSRFKLRIAERSESLGSPGTLGRYHRVAWEFKNDGGPTIRTIRVRVDYYDKSGEVLETKDFLVTYSGVPPIEPGQTRVANTIQNLKKGNFDRYELTIIEIN